MVSEALFFAVVGLIVSLDAVALTLARVETYRSSTTNKHLLVWAALNAAWHGGLLLFYVFMLDIALEALRRALASVDLEWLRLSIPFFGAQVAWFFAELQRHFFTLFAVLAMLLVWFTYSKKVRDTPTDPQAEKLDRWLQLVVTPLQRVLSERAYRENLQAALVAIDMLALAALLKASEEAMTATQKVAMTAIVASVVFTLVYVAALLARSEQAETAASLRNESDHSAKSNIALSQFWILLTLRLLEPFLIFYFLLKLFARISTGADMNSPALLLASALMVAAIVKIHGLPEIVKAVRTQATKT